MNISKETRRQRALDLKALMAGNRLTLKAVCSKARVNYESAQNALGRLIRENQIDAISDDRLSDLEEAAQKLAEKNLQPSNS